MEKLEITGSISGIKVPQKPNIASVEQDVIVAPAASDYYQQPQTDLDKMQDRLANLIVTERPKQSIW